VGLGLGNCCCTTSTFPPEPTPGPCEYDFFCPDATYDSKVLDPATTFSILFSILDNDTTCFESCDACPSSPLELVLGPGGACNPTPYQLMCSFTDGPFSPDTFWAECNDDCFLADFCGFTSMSRECTAVDDEFICPDPPNYPAGATSTSVLYISAYLRIFKDGCFRLVILMVQYQTVSSEMVPLVCNVSSWANYTGTLTCCGDTTLVENDSDSCSETTGPCPSSCGASLSDNILTMNCP